MNAATAPDDPAIVQVSRDDGIVHLRLNRPDKGNALSAALVAGISAAVQQAHQEPTRLLVLSGEGRHFCTGFDLSALELETDDSLLARFTRVELMLQAIHAAPFPTLALAHGRTMGAGADIFCACSERWIVDDAQFAFPGAGFGLVLGTARLAEAVGAYEKAREIDPSVLFAQQGLQRSRERARLDGQLRRAIEDPLRLSDARVAGATAELLQRARQASPTGPVLRQQIETLQELLQRAAEPVAVTLRSDRETEVTVYKVARLGRFAQRELSLRPGTYTAVGMRNGYRDVRRTFTVTHDSAPPTVTIICTEAI